MATTAVLGRSAHAGKGHSLRAKYLFWWLPVLTPPRGTRGRVSQVLPDFFISRAGAHPGERAMVASYGSTLLMG